MRRAIPYGHRRIEAAEKVYLYARDHLGSIRETYDVDGEDLADRFDYDPYGRRTWLGGTEGRISMKDYTRKLVMCLMVSCTLGIMTGCCDSEDARQESNDWSFQEIELKLAEAKWLLSEKESGYQSKYQEFRLAVDLRKLADQAARKSFDELSSSGTALQPQLRAETLLTYALLFEEEEAVKAEMLEAVAYSKANAFYCAIASADLARLLSGEDERVTVKEHLKHAARNAEIYLFKNNSMIDHQFLMIIAHIKRARMEANVTDDEILEDVSRSSPFRTVYLDTVARTDLERVNFFERKEPFIAFVPERE